MSFKDVIKSSVYQSLAGNADLTAGAVIAVLMISAMIGIYVYFVYRYSSRAAFYSKDLNVTIAGMPVVIAAIMIAMQSNLIVSLGMVGALSIVRFRNAIKNPLDLLYLFWAVSAGIICGVGLRLLAVLLCVMMTVMILVLQNIPNVKASNVLVIRVKEDFLTGGGIYKVRKILNQYCKNIKEKSRSYRQDEVEMIYELRVSREDELLKALRETEGIGQIHLLIHDGEYRA